MRRKSWRSLYQSCADTQDTKTLQRRFAAQRTGLQKGKRRVSMYQAFLIKYGEIGVKGKNRHIFEDTLVSQTANALRSFDGEFTVRNENGRIYADSQTAFDFD